MLVGRNGKIFTATLAGCHVPLADMERALRRADCDLKDMKRAFLEADGGISILKESTGAVRAGVAGDEAEGPDGLERAR